MTITTDDTIIVTSPPVASASAGATVNIMINDPRPAPAKPLSHKALPAAKSPPLVPKKDALPIFGSLIPAPLALTPESYEDGDHHKYTRFRTPDGSTAVFKEDPKDHNHVELTLTDGKTGLVTTTRGDKRGFEAIAGDRKDATSNWHVVYDTLKCGKESKQINVNETESVTRDRLQQFAQEHPQIAEALRKLPLPVTEIGGYPVTFAQAVDTPTHFRACPTDRSGILLEQLNEKSAKR